MTFVQDYPLPLSSYPAEPGASLHSLLLDRMRADPLNAIATAIFVFAIVHTFFAVRFVMASRAVQASKDEQALAAGRPPRPSITAEVLHFFGEVEVIFGLWVVPLVIAIALWRGWGTAVNYLDSVNYTEPLFVVVIMALASTRPIVELAERALSRIAALGKGTPGAWWLAIVTLAPLLGSFITEPAAMTIGALLLSRQFYGLEPSTRLKYATLGLLFVNVSVGGTLTHFAAPPVLMVARPWDWNSVFMMTTFGWRAVMAVAVSALAYRLFFIREFRILRERQAAARADRQNTPAESSTLRPVPAWVTLVHVLFIFWTVVNAHHPALFVGGFLFFLGFDRATAVYSTLDDFKTPLLVGFFLAGLVIHGGLQGWWIGPLLGRLAETPLFFGAMILTAFNDNALITYLATLVPGLGANLKVAVVAGAVTGGGLTVIANAPNPAGQALLSRFFDGAIHPFLLLSAAAVPTLIAIIAFRLI
jgi:Putative Na+/H+ antiporter